MPAPPHGVCGRVVKVLCCALLLRVSSRQDCSLVYFVPMSTDLPDVAPAFIMKPIAFEHALPPAMVLPTPPPTPAVRPFKWATRGVTVLVTSLLPWLLALLPSCLRSCYPPLPLNCWCG